MQETTTRYRTSNTPPGTVSGEALHPAVRSIGGASRHIGEMNHLIRIHAGRPILNPYDGGSESLAYLREQRDLAVAALDRAINEYATTLGITED